MKAAPKKLVYGEGYFDCPIDEATHVELNMPGPMPYRCLPVILSGKRDGTNCWTWNGDTEKPTLRPSILTQNHLHRCHTWVNDGQAQFLDDCSHELAGKTLALLDVVTQPQEAAPTAAREGEGMMVLQEQRTLDQAVIGGMRTFPNGCNFRLIITDGKPEIEYGCYGVHVNLCQGDERLLYEWFVRNGEQRCSLPISPETKMTLLKRKPCPHCGAPLFKLTQPQEAAR